MALNKNILLKVLAFLFLSCGNQENSKKAILEMADTAVVIDQKEQKPAPEQFLESLENRDELASFFQDNWHFVYHRDNRCEGSTDGEVASLSPSSIDSIIVLQVYNDGDSWLCEKIAPSTYDLEFVLDKELENWDRFEIIQYEDQHPNETIIQGGGESDCILLHYNKDRLIEKLEYRSEDPG
jgi:hypothetical protein